MIEANGAMPVPVANIHRLRPGSNASRTSVPVGLRRMHIVSLGRIFCRCSVSGPPGTLIE